MSPTRSSGAQTNAALSPSFIPIPGYVFTVEITLTKVDPDAVLQADSIGELRQGLLCLSGFQELPALYLSSLLLRSVSISDAGVSQKTRDRFNALLDTVDKTTSVSPDSILNTNRLFSGCTRGSPSVGRRLQATSGATNWSNPLVASLTLGFTMRLPVPDPWDPSYGSLDRGTLQNNYLALALSLSSRLHDPALLVDDPFASMEQLYFQSKVRAVLFSALALPAVLDFSIPSRSPDPPAPTGFSLSRSPDALIQQSELLQRYKAAYIVFMGGLRGAVAITSVSYAVDFNAPSGPVDEPSTSADDGVIAGIVIGVLIGVLAISYLVVRALAKQARSKGLGSTKVMGLVSKSPPSQSPFSSGQQGYADDIAHSQSYTFSGVSPMRKSRRVAALPIVPAMPNFVATSLSSSHSPSPMTNPLSR
jgi:hypothetical protein